MSDDDFQRVIAEEKARGSRRRLPDEEVLRMKHEAKDDFNNFLERGDKKGFLRWLKDGYGHEADSEVYRQSVAAWDEEVQRRKKNR